MTRTRSESRIVGIVLSFLFAFFVMIGLLAATTTVLGYAVSFIRGGGLGSARSAPWIALGGLAAAFVVAPWASRQTGDDDRHSLIATATGVAGAGLMTIAASLARDIKDLADIGPLQIAVVAIAGLVVLGSPFIARHMLRLKLTEKASSVTDQFLSRPGDSSATTRSPSWWELALLGAGIAALIVGLAYVLASGPLGHDESVYAVKARSWYEGTPSTGFDIYRPLGLPVIGWVVLHFSDSEVAFRTAGIALAVGTVTVMWFAGRTMLSSGAAWIGAGLFVASESYLRRATEFLNDLASAGLLLATMLVIWYHFERRPDSWWLVLAAPLAAGAYYVRYGSVLGLAVIALVAGAVWVQDLRRSWRQIAATGAASLLLLVPHFVYATDRTGSPLGIFQSARTSVDGGGGGLGEYADFFSELLAGTLGAVVMVAGAVYTLVLVVIAIRKRRWPTMTRTAVFLTASALLFTVALGAFTHAEPRFIFMPLMAVLLVGGQAVAAILSHLRVSVRWVIAVPLAVTIAYAAVTGATQMQDAMDTITSRREVIVGAAEVARSDAGDAACSIRSSYVPQLTWYSACSTYTFIDKFLTVDDTSYLVLFEHGKRQPQGAALDAELARTPGTPMSVVLDPHDRIGDGFVYEYEPRP